MNGITALRAIHVLAGALWVGAAFLNAFFLVPSIMAAGPAGGQVMRAMVQLRRAPVFMNSVMAVTLLSGLGLYSWASGGFRGQWVASNMGLAFTVGALLAFLSAGLGLFVIVPTVKRLGQLGAAVAAAGAPPSPEQAAEMAASQQRLLRVSQVGSALVLAAIILMAIARYL